MARNKKKKDGNPKIAAGSKKWRQYMTIPIQVLWEVGVAMLEGALKYGRHNYRAEGGRVSTYTDAAKGHVDQFLEGEDIDPDSGVHHISKAIASLVVLRDGLMIGNCVDDRPPKANVSKVRNDLQKIVNKLYETYPNAPEPFTELNRRK